MQSKVDLDFNMKKIFLTQQITELKRRIKKIGKFSILSEERLDPEFTQTNKLPVINKEDQISNLNQLTEQLEKLIMTRQSMKDEVERANLEKLRLQANNILAKKKSYMNSVVTAKQSTIIDFEKVIIVKKIKKKKVNPFSEG
jgi:hypothetical protein